MPQAFVIHSDDNVATAIDDLPAGPVILRGDAGKASSGALAPVKAGHKFALCPIPEGHPVIKYGCAIGRATRAIAAGEWVHLHNLASNFDERSNSLDHDSGEPTDMEEAYR